MWSKDIEVLYYIAAFAILATALLILAATFASAVQSLELSCISAALLIISEYSERTDVSEGFALYFFINATYSSANAS